MKITVKENRKLIIINPQNTQNENDTEKILLQVPEKYEDFNKKIVFITPDGNVWDIITNNEYLIKKAITKYNQVDFYIWLTKDDVDFRSQTKTLKFYYNVDASDEITPEEIGGVNTVINLLEEEITKVDNMDINAVKVGDTATITITDKNGISKSVEIKDGQVSQQQIQEIIQIVQEAIDMPENLSDLNEDSTHRTVTDNEKSTWNNKQNALVSGTNIKTINNQSILGEGNIVIEGGSGTTDYSDLENKPKINNVELNGNKSLQDLGVQPRGNYALNEDIPTKTSELQNDSGFITGYTETDPTVPSHVKNISQADISNWNNKSDFSGDYEDLDNQPSINGVTLLGNKTAEQLGITSSLCNLGLVTDYDQNNRLDLNSLPCGVYLLYRRYSIDLYMKATYKGNEILGHYYHNDGDELGIIFLTKYKEITDELAEREYIGSIESFTLMESSPKIRRYSADIQISPNEVSVGSASSQTIEPVVLSRSQTITGKKTFNTLPESSVVPTTDNQLVNKKYVDDSIGDIETVLTTITTGGGVNGNS